MNIFKSSSWDRIWIQKFCAVGVDVGLVELKYRFNVGGMEGEGTSADYLSKCTSSEIVSEYLCHT